MKHFVCAGAFMLVGVLTSSADETYRWDGFYAGILGSISANEVDNGPGGKASHFSGSAIGAFAGYRVSAGSLLLGAEIDAALVSAEKTYPGEFYGINTKASARLTLGRPIGTFLPFLTAGAALTHASVEISRLSGQASHFGVVFGGGLEILVASNVSVRAQYLHTEYNLQGYGEWYGSPFKLRPADNTIEVGVGYRF